MEEVLKVAGLTSLQFFLNAQMFLLDAQMMPSVKIATKLSEALEVSLDFLVGKSSLLVKDKNMLERLEDIAKLPTAKQTELFNVMDAYLRDYRTGKAYVKK